MPNYEYECAACTHQWEDIHTISNRDAPCALPCPHCGERQVCRGWRSSPTMGVDAALKPHPAFVEGMERVRAKLGRYNPTVRENIDRAVSMRGAKYGAQ